MGPLMRQVHAWLAWVFVAAIVVQVFLAGAAIPQLGGIGSFATHRDFGYLIGLLTLLVLIAALHPVNALVMFGLGVLYARAVWRERAVAVDVAAA